MILTPTAGAFLHRILSVVFLAILLAVPLRASAQNNGSIEGRVVDAATMEPLLGVNVRVVGTSSGASTDVDGFFTLQLEPGSYTLRFSFLGYETSQAGPLQVAAGETTVLDVQLRETVLISDELVVTGSRRPEKLLDAPLSIETVSADELARSGGTFYSAIANMKGVDYVDVGLNAQGISARGFTNHFNTRMLQMVDGRLAQLPGTGLPQGNFLPNAALDLRSIEVVLGPASALYGPNAHTGVVNVITKTPWDESGVSVSLRGGSQELLDANYRVAGTVNDRFGFKITGQNLRGQDFEPRREDGTHFYGGTTIFESDVIDDYSIESDKVDGALYYRFGGVEARVSAGWSQNTNFGLTNNGRNHIRDWTVTYQQVQLTHENVYASYTHTANDAGGTYQLNQVVPAVQAQVNAGIPLESIDLEGLRGAFGFIDKGQLHDAEIQYRDTFGSLDVVGGVQYRSYKPDSEGTFLADANGEDLSAEELGGYVQLDTRLLQDKLRIVAAARLDNHSNYETQFSPKAALVYTVAPGHNVRLGYNRAFKSPTILESFLYLPIDVTAAVPGYWLNALGNIDGFTLKDATGAVVQTIDPMRPEAVDAFELGYKGVFGNQLFVDAVAYTSTYTDFISPLTTVANGFALIPFDADGNAITYPGSAFNGLLTYFNFGEATVRGFDLGLNYYASERLNLSANTSLIERVSFESELEGQEFLLNVPEAKVKVSATISDVALEGSFVSLSSRWNSAYRFRSGYWNSDVLLDPARDATTAAEIDARLVTDLTAGAEIPGTGVNVVLSVTNLFDDQGIDVLGSPVRGRLVWVSLNYGIQGLRF